MDLFPVQKGCPLDQVSQFIPIPGGANANVAVAAARLGASSAMIGKVGRDEYGRILMDTLAGNGVDIRGLRMDEKLPTTAVRIADPSPGSFQYHFRREGNADLALSVEDLDEEMLASAKILHCCSLLLVKEGTREAQFRAVEKARNSGALISFDVNHRPGLWQEKGAALEWIGKMVSLADIVKANRNEMELLTGVSDPILAGKEIINRGVKLAAITLGSAGSFFGTAALHGFVPTFHLDAVNTIGCGDAFMAGVLVKLLQPGLDFSTLQRPALEFLFRYGNAVAALTSTVEGVNPGLPTAGEVEDFIRSRGS